MSFKLTPAYLDTVLAPLRSGDFAGFLAHVDPDVKWRVGASDERATCGSGVYNVASLRECMLPFMVAAFEPGVFRSKCQAVEVVGNKAIVEDDVTIPMKNGEIYQNKQCFVLEFSPSTGKIVKNRVYVDTEVIAAAKRAHGVEV